MRLQEDTSHMRDANVRLHGRILYLTEDPSFVRAQLEGNDPAWSLANKLRDDISTDEITPAYICYYYDETLGEFPYLGLKCRDEFPITRGAVKRGGFVAAVSGKRRGKGSSREQSPYAEMCAGIKIVVPAVKPGDEGFVLTDIRFSHEYVTPMAAIFFEQLVGKDAKVNDPGSILMFRDHLTFLPEAMTPERVKEGLLDVALQLEKKQREFATAQGIKLYGELRLGHH